MGVVYKLTSQVIDFIINQKKATPALGCRELAKCVSQEFNFHVSKSSVNDVLQLHQLSSPLGRRGPSRQKKERKKFEIPTEKRGLLFSGSGGEHAEREDPLPEAVVAPPPHPQAAIIMAKVFPAASFLGEKPVPGEKIKVFQNAGAIFIWALLREASAKSPLARFFTEKFKDLSEQDTTRVIDFLTILLVMNINPQEALATGFKQLAWMLCGMDKVSTPEQILYKIRQAQLGDEIFLKISLELPSVFCQIEKIRVYMEDGQEVLMDAQCNILNGENVQSGQIMFLEKCISIVNSQLINNVHPIVMYQAPTECRMGEEEFSDKFFTFLAALENLSKNRIKKIALFDEQDQELVSFDNMPIKRRFFIAGLSPEQIMFSELKTLANKGLSKEHRQKARIFNQEYFLTQASFNFTEKQAGFPQILGRVIFLATSPDKNPDLAVITNAPEELFSSIKVVSLYLTHWPRVDMGKIARFTGPNFIIKSNNFEKNDLNQCLLACYNTEDLFKGLADFFISVCQQRFLPQCPPGTDPKDVLNAIFSLEGNILEEKDHIVIRFILSSGKPFLYRLLLEQAVFIFNLGGFRDEKSKNLIIFNS